MKANKFFLSSALVFSFLVPTYFATTSNAQQGSKSAPELAVAEYQVGAVLYMPVSYTHLTLPTKRIV